MKTVNKEGQKRQKKKKNSYFFYAAKRVQPQGNQ